MPSVRFETPEDVGLSFEVAGPGSRVAAGLVDAAVVIALVLAVGVAFFASGLIAVDAGDLSGGSVLGATGGLALVIVLAIPSLINVGYHLAAELLLDGQTPGKRLLHLRVVMEGGYALSPSACVIRNAGRMVDMLPAFYLVGLIAMLVSRDRKRLGDLMAGTLVVRHRAVKLPEARFAGETYATLPSRAFTLRHEHLDKLGADALALLDGYFDRVEGLDAESASRLAETLASSLASRMGLEAASVPGHARELLKEVYLALRERLASSRRISG